MRGSYLFLKFCPGTSDVSGFKKNIVLNFNSQSYIVERIKHAVQQTHIPKYSENAYFVLFQIHLPSNTYQYIFQAFKKFSLFKLLH